MTTNNDPSPAWLPDAFCVCMVPSRRGSEPPSPVVDACQALNVSQIPCHVTAESVAEGFEFRVMVPPGKALEAASVLELQISNLEMDASWREYLVNLSDEDFEAIKPESICAGLLDRAARLKKAYEDELSARPRYADPSHQERSEA
jgi:hypothetical protein